MFWDINEFHGCGRCYSCARVPKNVRKLKSLSNHQNSYSYDIRDFISCDTIGVIYAIKCPCNMLYIGRTKRASKVRMEEHVRNIRQGYDKYHLSIHFRDKQIENPEGMQFWGTEAPKHHWRGSNFVREISKRESWWIHQLGSLWPGG